VAEEFSLTASVTTDIYTVPTGKRAFVATVVFSNGSGSLQTGASYVKVSGSYYRLASTANISAGVVSSAITSVTFAPGYIFEAGESFALNVSADMTGIAVIVEFPNTDPLRSAKLVEPTTGADRTLLTASGAVSVMGNAMNFISALGVTAFTNGSGSAITCATKWTVGSTTLTLSSNSANNNTRQIGLAPSSLSSGDVIAINVSADLTGGIAWINVVERP
jgi:hypothetical protein